MFLTIHKLFTKEDIAIADIIRTFCSQRSLPVIPVETGIHSRAVTG